MNPKILLMGVKNWRMAIPCNHQPGENLFGLSASAAVIKRQLSKHVDIAFAHIYSGSQHPIDNVQEVVVDVQVSSGSVQR